MKILNGGDLENNMLLAVSVSANVDAKGKILGYIVKGGSVVPDYFADKAEIRFVAASKNDYPAYTPTSTYTHD